MAIKKLDFKFINQVRRNEQVKELADTINNNADELDSTQLIAGVLYNGYTSNVASTKKIYCHPISFGNTGEFRIACLIFNNTATAFTPTTFANFIETLYNEIGSAVRIVATGAFMSSENSPSITSHLGIDGNGVYYLAGSKTTDIGLSAKTFSTKADFITAITTAFNDGVNAIN